MEYKLSKIFVDRIAQNDSITKRVLKIFPDTPARIVIPDEQFMSDLGSMSLAEGKRTLWLTHFKGRFLKPCPGTADTYRCCNYLVINETTNCPIDCTYCILQGYVSNPAITIYTNYEKIIDELKQISKNNPNRILRIGTGELTDSLALDPITGLAGFLIDEIRKLPNVLLELKSKTDHINHIPDSYPEKIILAWSVNPEQTVQADEHKAAPIAKRLQAAAKAAEKGFKIGLHFDPIIYLPEWKAGYLELVKQIGNHVPPQSIAWISLGSLRYPPHLKEIIRSRFPRSRIFSGEQISGIDGKMRYLRPLRAEIYKTIYNALRETLGDVFIYFCMESEDIWKEVIGSLPRTNQDVDFLFAQHLSHKFPELRLPRPAPEVYDQPVQI